MSSVFHSWYTNQELPGIRFEHKDANGNVVDLSSGWTFSAQVVDPATNGIIITQSTNFTGAATTPNLTLDRWTSTTLDAIIADLGTTKQKVYELRVYLRQTSDSTDEVPMSSTPLRVEFKLAAS